MADLHVIDASRASALIERARNAAQDGEQRLGAGRAREASLRLRDASALLRLAAAALDPEVTRWSTSPKKDDASVVTRVRSAGLKG
jgi:hypothetical protein